VGGRRRKNVGGRPPKDPDEVLGHKVQVHLNRPDFETLERLAEKAGERVGSTARKLLERALRRRRT
jgi:hypothetical protein